MQSRVFTSKTDYFVVAISVLVFKILLLYWGYVVAADDYSLALVWARWDVRHYLRIAEHWYSGADLNPEDHLFLFHFPPLYPASVAFFGYFGFSTLTAGYVAAITFSVVSSILFFELVRAEFADRKIAYLATFFLNTYPTAYVTNIPYSESMFLVFSVGMFYALRIKNKFILGCIMVLLATFTRAVGVLLLPSLTYEWFFRLRKKQIGVLDNLFFVVTLSGSSIYFLVRVWLIKIYREQRMWTSPEVPNPDLSIWPFEETLYSWKKLIFETAFLEPTSKFMMTQGWPAIFLAFTLLVTVVSLRRLPISYSLYSLSSVLFVSTMFWAIATARYMLLVFPVFMFFSLVKNKIVIVAYSFVSTALLFYFAKQFVGGGWVW